jgi:nitrite reductase (NADH) small subunit
MSKRKTWVRVTDCQNIPLREGRLVRVASRDVAIFNLGDRFLAIDNRCPHKGGPLSEGIVSGTTVVCPLHAWKVSLETGAVDRQADSPACVETFRTRLEGDVVLIEVRTDPATVAQERAAWTWEEQGVENAS